MEDGYGLILKSAQNSPFRDIFLSDIKAIINYNYMIVLIFCCLYSEQIQFECKAMKKILATSILVLLGGFAASAYAAKDFLNVSYDPTREFYQ